MLNTIRDWFRPRTARPGPDSDFWYRPAETRSTSGACVTDDTALTVATFFACIRILSQTLSSLPLLMYRRRPDGGKERAPDHRLYDILHDAPNVWQTASEWKLLGMAWLILRGNWYNLIVRGPRGEPASQLIPLSSDRMSVNQLPNKRLQYVYRELGREPRIFTQDQILHVRGLSLDGIVGVSVLTYARNAIGLGLAQESHGASLFSNGSLPPFALETAERMNETAIKNFRAGWRGMHSGAKNAHNPPILQGGMKIHELSLTNEDSQWLESRKFSGEEICRFCGVPPHMAALLDRATFCMPKDVEVLTDRGPKSIADVKAGEFVWSVDGDKGMKLSRVRYSVCTGIDDILRISTTNRTVRANARHRFLVRRKHPAPKPGVGGYQVVEWRNEWIRAGELRVGDTLVLSDRLPIEGTAHLATRKASLGFVELCGLILGDGNVFRKRGVSIARAINAGYMDHYRDVMRREFSKTRDGGKGPACRRQRAPIFLTEAPRQTRFASVLAADELETLGLCGNARTKRVPGWVFQLPEGMRLGFLRGFLDADGSVDTKGRIAYHSVNEVMLSQVRHLCIGCGIPVTNLRCQEGVTVLPNGKPQAYKIFAFTCSDPGANRRIGSHDPRYIERFKNGKPFNRKGRNYPRHGGRHFDLPGCTLSRINAIAKEPPEPVYDLEVEGTHSFIANGVVVHNSNIEHQGMEFVRYTIRPWCTLWQQAIGRDLLGEDDKEYFAEFLLDDLQRGDTPSRYAAYNVGLQAGFLTRNEVRTWENLNPIEGGDEPLEPLNMVPTGTRSEPDEEPEELEPEEPPEEPPEETQRRERRSRQRELQESFRPMLRDAAQRVVFAEIRGLQARADKADRDRKRWLEWAGEFYLSHREYARKTMQPFTASWNLATGRDIDTSLTITSLCVSAQADLAAAKSVPSLLEEWTETRSDLVAGILESCFFVGEQP